MCRLRAAAVLALLALAFVVAAPAMASEEKAAPKVERYIKLNPFAAPISRSNRITGRLNVELVLELLKPENLPQVQEQMPRGTHLGAGHELEVRWGQQVQRLIPAAQRVKFTASGTEATHLAIRLARSFTGKTRVVKFEGHFHGWHDYATAAVDPPYDVPTSSGVPAEALATMLVLPADLAAVLAALRG